MWSVAFSPDGQYLVSGSWDKTVKLWLVKSGECTRTMEGHSEPVCSVAFSPDGQYLASGSGDKTVKLWHVESGECTRTMRGHSHFVYSVAFSPDGQYLASGSRDETVKLWSTPHRERRLQTRDRMYALLSALKHNECDSHCGVYQLDIHGGGQVPVIQEMVAWWVPEWLI